MKKFVLKILKFLSIGLVCLFLVDFVISFGLKSSYYKNNESWNALFNGKINDEIIVFGSSRAFVHFDPILLEKLTNKKFYNLGWNAAKAEQIQFRISLYDKFKHHLPNKIIVVIDFGSFEKKSDKLSSEFFPFIYSVPSLLLEIYKDFNFDLRYYIPFLRYKLLQKEIKVGIQNHFVESNVLNNKVKGYMEVESNWDSSALDSMKVNYPKGAKITFDYEKILNLKKQVYALHNQGVEVIWLITPYHQEYLELVTNENEILKILKRNLFDEFGLLYDYSNWDKSSDYSLFYNSTHLNKDGVLIFNQEIAKKIFSD